MEKLEAKIDFLLLIVLLIGRDKLGPLQALDPKFFERILSNMGDVQ